MFLHFFSNIFSLFIIIIRNWNTTTLILLFDNLSPIYDLYNIILKEVCNMLFFLIIKDILIIFLWVYYWILDRLLFIRFRLFLLFIPLLKITLYYHFENIFVVFNSHLIMNQFFIISFYFKIYFLHFSDFFKPIIDFLL